MTLPVIRGGECVVAALRRLDHPADVRPVGSVADEQELVEEIAPASAVAAGVGETDHRRVGGEQRRMWRCRWTPCDKSRPCSSTSSCDIAKNDGSYAHAES